MILRVFILFICALTGTSQALEVSVTGAVQNPGPQESIKSIRIFNALVAAQPTSQSFFLGGMLLRTDQLAEQKNLQAGLLYDLQIAGNTFFTRQTPGLAQSLVRLANKISQLTPTGRVAAEFNLTKLSFNPAKNIPLKNFDHIFIPNRPQGIYVLGAVKKPGLYGFNNKSVVNIARKIKRRFANLDLVWVIQPDASIEKVGVALWNQQLEKVAALGSIIFIPFADKALNGTQNFNPEMAKFLSTQNISALNALP